MNHFDYLRTLPKKAVLLCCVLIEFLVGAMRYATGSELALSLFYLFPASLAAWYVGKKQKEYTI